MQWFYLPLGAALLWAIGNHVDKFLIGRYFRGSSPKSMIAIQIVVDLFTLPVLYFLDSDIFSVPYAQIAILIALGAFAIIPIILYLYALQEGEASVVIPLFQTIPVFLYILGYFVLGEQLTFRQTIASALIIMGAFFISVDIFERKFRTKAKVLLCMLIASLCWAIRGVVFKPIVAENKFWPVNFWEFAGIVIMGFVLLLFVKSFRQAWIQMFYNNTKKIIALNIFNETINIAASFMVNFAYLFAPIVLVSVMGSFQPFFVFLIGIFITLFIPRFGKETMITSHLVQKFLAIGVMIFGTYLLNS